jgi:hypothetical protein
MGRKPVTTYRHRRGRSRLRSLLLLDVLAGLLALAGLAALNSHFLVASGKPPVRVSGALPAPTTSASRSIPAIPSPLPATLTGVPRSVPLQLSIPEINVRTQLVRLGLNPDGTLQVPTDFSVAGWYALGSSPGEPGAAVIVGHVDSKQGPAVFYRLGELAPGSLVRIALTDEAQVCFACMR